MGDDGKLYIAPEVIDIYRKGTTTVLPTSSQTNSNHAQSSYQMRRSSHQTNLKQSECLRAMCCLEKIFANISHRTLTQSTIKNQEDALSAIEKLHSMGPSIVIITSLFYGSPDEILIIASKKEGIFKITYHQRRRKLTTVIFRRQTNKAEAVCPKDSSLLHRNW